MSSVYGTPWLCQISFIGFLRKYRFVRKPFVCGRVFSFPPAGDMPRQPTAPRDFVHRMHKVLGENRFITKIVRAVHRRLRQAPAASVFRIVAPLLCLAADLPLSTCSPDRSAAYYHDAFRHICQGTKGTSISPASLIL